MKLSVFLHDFLVILLMQDINKLVYHYDISCGSNIWEEWWGMESGKSWGI